VSRGVCLAYRKIVPDLILIFAIQGHENVLSRNLRDFNPAVRRKILDNFNESSEDVGMIVRTLKLKLTKTQETQLNQWLWNLTGVYNWAIKKIEHDAQDGIYHSAFAFVNLTANHSKQMEIPSHTLQGVSSQAYNAWQRCFKKVAKKPHLKGFRNKLTSIPFPDPPKQPKDNRIGIPGIGKVRYYKQELPETIPSRLIKRIKQSVLTPVLIRC